MPCLESSFFIVAVASAQFTWPDEENVKFMRLCAEVFFDKWPLWQHWNSDSEGCTWTCMTPCWETLEGSSWPQQTFWNMSEQDFCVYVKLSALTGSQ